ncbi:hypothetical protein CRENBAI_013809 [Crenichthys baileyi]|uniref:Uncharacterized protein n=1 Tax=Crenichthys baileyi TaxID=28760 RepID=A0AAV9SIK4_9TELE
MAVGPNKWVNGGVWGIGGSGSSGVGMPFFWQLGSLWVPQALFAPEGLVPGCTGLPLLSAFLGIAPWVKYRARTGVLCYLQFSPGVMDGAIAGGFSRVVGSSLLLWCPDLLLLVSCGLRGRTGPWWAGFGTRLTDSMQSPGFPF